MKKITIQTVVFSAALATFSAATAPVLATSVYDDAIGYWAFEEQTGQAASDGSLTTSIDMQLGTTNGADAQDPTWVPGRIGGGMLAENGQFLTSGGDVNALDFGRDDPLTISGWIKKNSVTGAAGEEIALVSKMENSGNFRGWWVFSDRDGNIDFLIRSTNTAANRLGIETVTPQITTTDWYHVAVTFDYDATDATRGARIYINGEQVDAQVQSSSAGMLQEPPLSTVNDRSFNIGGRNDAGVGIGGYIDEVAVWGRVISPEEVSAAAVPEPSGLILAALGASMFFRRRRKKA
jgi:hypothetical protein